MSLNSEISRLIEEVDESLLESINFSIARLMEGAKSGNFSEEETEIDSPYTFTSGHYLPNTEIMTPDVFVEITSQLIEDAQKREGIEENKRVSLVEEYPADRFDSFGTEVIAYKLIKRSPANMSADGNSRMQKGFTHYDKLTIPAFPNSVLEIEARPIDHIVELQCWSKSARIANRRAIWLERLLINHKWAYISHGADRFKFEERSTDWYTNPGGQSLYVRPLRFYFRSFEFRIKSNSIVQHIRLELENLGLDKS